MLPDKKLRTNRRALGICSKLGLLPFHLKNQGREMVLSISSFRGALWIGLLSASIFYVGYISMRLLEVKVRQHETEFSVIGIHISRCVISAVMTFLAYDGFVAHGGEKAAIYNYTADRGERKKPGKSLHSFIQDQMVLIVPGMLYPFSIFFVSFFLWKRDSTQFLYAVLPEKWQTMTTLALCAMFEFIVTFFWMAHCHLFIFSNTLFQQKLEVLLENELHFETGSRLEDLEHKVVIMREVQTAVGIHGVGDRRSIFAQKVICLSLSIVGFFFFIRLIGVMPVVPFMFLVIGINCICFYPVMWNSAHMIPTQMKKLRREVLRRLPNSRLKTIAYLKLRVKSVPACSFQAGSFRSIERNSTLIFADFVSSNLASVLISL